jgi:hypothetical protein
MCFVYTQYFRAIFSRNPRSREKSHAISRKSFPETTIFFLTLLQKTMSSYEKQQQLQEAFFQETAPNSTSLETLASLKAAQGWYKNGSNEWNALQSIAHEELRYLVAGAEMIKSSPVLQRNLGTGTQSMMMAGQLLRQHAAKKVFDDAISGSLTATRRKELKIDRTADANNALTSLIG